MGHSVLSFVLGTRRLMKRYVLVMHKQVEEKSWLKREVMSSHFQESREESKAYTAPLHLIVMCGESLCCRDVPCMPS